MISITNKLFGFTAARRRTRRILVAAYCCAIAAFAVTFLMDQSRNSLNGFGILIALQMLINLPSLLGGVRAGGIVKPFRGVHWVPLQAREDVQSISLLSGSPKCSEDASLDERETLLRNRVHFVAYTVARWLALILFAAYGLLALFHADWLRQAGLFCFLLLALTLWSLPQILILWTEPDMEEPR